MLRPFCIALLLVSALGAQTFGISGSVKDSTDAVIPGEYGHSAGGVLNVWMKPGGNQLHGNLYYLWPVAPGNPTRKLWFDLSAFQRVICSIGSPPVWRHFSNSGKNVRNSPALRNLNFPVFKNLRLSGRLALEFRTELFKATDSPYFGQANNISFFTNDSIAPDGPGIGEIRKRPLRYASHPVRAEIVLLAHRKELL